MKHAQELVCWELQNTSERNQRHMNYMERLSRPQNERIRTLKTSTLPKLISRRTAILSKFLEIFFRCRQGYTQVDTASTGQKYPKQLQKG